MVLRKRIFTPIIWAAIAFGLLIGCQSQPTSRLVAPSSSGIGVGITADSCPDVELPVGRQVAWTNQDNYEHIVRDQPTGGNPLFDSGILYTGDRFTFTFSVAGSYTYTYSSYGSLTGTVNIQQ